MRNFNSIAIFMAISISTAGAFAENVQAVVEGDLQAEIAEESAGIASSGPKVTILNQQAVKQQPITNVEASPLIDSRAVQLRRARQDAEVATEQAIVEKLEQSRLADEERRAKALFGGAQLQAQEQQAAQQVQTQTQVQVVEPAAPSPSMEEVKAELVNTVREELSAQKPEPKKSETYFSGNVGLTEYGDAINVESIIATGFSFGKILDNGFIVEGQFLYSNFYIDKTYWVNPSAPVYDELDQYNFAAAVKWTPLRGVLLPYVGGVASYTYRKYSEVNKWGYQYYNQYNKGNINNESESNALDIGFTAGVNVKLSEDFLVGFDYQYMKNVTHKANSPWLGKQYRSWGSPLEEFDYYTMQVSAKYLF